MSKRKKKKPDPEALFGELRGLLQSGSLSRGQRTQVWSICARMRKHHPELYDGEWVPYLRSYARVWRPDLLVVHDTQELERAIQLAPFARFTLESTTEAHTHVDTTLSKRFNRLLRSRLLAHVDAIDTQNPETLRLLLSSDHVHGLTKIHTRMHAHHGVVDVLRDLSKSSSHATLESLQLTDGTEIYNQGATLDDIAPFPVLHTLRLARIPLDRRQLVALARAPMVKALERIELDDMGMHEGDLTYLIDQGTFETTRELVIGHLKNLSATTHTLCALLDMANPELESLAITSSFRRYKPIALLDKIASLPFPRLHTLDLSGNTLGITALRRLSASTHLENLRTLRLLDVPLDYTLSTWLTTHPFFSRLDAIDVFPYQLDDTQRDQVAHSTTLSTKAIASLLETK